MLTHLSVSNFQPFADVEVPLAPLTVFVGPSDEGKSALLRAIETVAFNRPPRRFLRAGAKECVIVLGVDTDNDGIEDTVVGWAKSKTETLYRIGDKEYTKLGRGVPEDVQELLRLREIPIESQWRLRPQFHEQGIDYAWLIRESPSRRARVFAVMTQIDRLVDAQGIARKDIRKRDDQLSDLRTEIADASAALENYVGLDAESRRATEAAEALDGLVATKNELVRAERLIEQRDELTRELRAYESLPSLTNVRQVKQQCANLKSATRLIKERDTLQKQIETVQKNLESLDDEKALLEKDLRDVRKRLGVCGVCGRKA